MALFEGVTLHKNQACFYAISLFSLFRFFGVPEDERVA